MATPPSAARGRHGCRQELAAVAPRGRRRAPPGAGRGQRAVPRPRRGVCGHGRLAEHRHPRRRHRGLPRPAGKGGRAPRALSRGSGARVAAGPRWSGSGAPGAAPPHSPLGPGDALGQRGRRGSVAARGSGEVRRARAAAPGLWKSGGRIGPG